MSHIHFPLYSTLYENTYDPLPSCYSKSGLLDLITEVSPLQDGSCHMLIFVRSVLDHPAGSTSSSNSSVPR